MTLAGKVAIVTGAGGEGSGRAIARRFAREGAIVVAADVNAAGAQRTAAEIAAQGGRAHGVLLDVGDEPAVRAVVSEAVERYGGLDVLINSASGPEYRPDLPLEFWEAIVRVELLGTMYATRHAIDAMRARGGGAIVNVSSTSALGFGRFHPGGSPAYDAAKAAVLHLAVGLRDLKAEGIRVNAVVPDALIAVDDMAAAVLRLATDPALAGRAMVLWRGRAPAFVPYGDAGYTFLE